MPNTPTTPASVASLMKDEEIEHLIDVCDKDANRHERESIVARRYSRVDSMRTLNTYASEERLTAAVLRDYVRLRKLNGKLKECLNQAYGDKMSTYRMIGNEVQNWGIVLAEAEKGDVKWANRLGIRFSTTRLLLRTARN